MDDPSGWSLTESDPQVFTELLRSLGVKGVQVDDLYSLDPDTLATLKPVYALIFLFKYVGADEGSSDGVEVEPQEVGLWFANQVINNSCGTLAALNAVMNIGPGSEPEPVQLGPELDNLKEFGAILDSMDLGHAISSSSTIRETHNSFSKSTPFSIDPSAYPDREKEDAYHFVAYVPHSGVLYELDGLRRQPLMHAAFDDGGEGWLEVARETIEKRIATYPPGSLMFNLLCVRGAAEPRLLRELSASTDPIERTRLSDQLEHERSRAERGRLENSLRRHNLIPAVFELFKALGESGIAKQCVESAEQKAKERQSKEKE